jgi:hypothetical protein
MKTKQEKSFDTVSFFRSIKEKLATQMSDMTLEQQKEFMKKVREGKIKIV